MFAKGLQETIDKANKNSTSMLKLEDGESAVIRILVPASELISVYEHTENINGNWQTITCLGREKCPLCQAGKKASLKIYVPVADRSDDNKVKIFKASKTVGQMMLGLIEEYGDLTKRDFKLYRQGKKLDTKYQFFPRDPQEDDLSKYEIPDIEKIVAPMSPEAIKAIMDGTDNGNVDDVSNEGVSGGSEDDYPF